MFETVFDPGAQSVQVADRFLDLALHIGHKVPGALRRQGLGISGEVIEANPSALPKDDLSNITGLLLPVGEDPFKRTPVRITHPLSWW